MDIDILQSQNPWWENPALIGQDQHLMAILGKAYRYVPSLVDNIKFDAGDVIVIRGPRQVEKTTALKIRKEK